MKRKALISGITGQDGSYLAEFLLEKDYEVYGVIRRSATDSTNNIEHILDDIKLEHADILDLSSLHRVFKYTEPDEVYNLAAQSHVGISFKQPLFTIKTTGLGAVNMLEAFRENVPYSRFYQAGSSEMFGNNHNGEFYQDENTPFNPASPYAAAKVLAHNIGCNYRRAYNIFISNGILFNHESPRRGSNFVTQKIVKAAYKIKKKELDVIQLGNLESRRDWGHAKDYVKGMWLMLQHNQPDDFVLATGISHSVLDFCKLVFKELEIDNYEDYIYSDVNTYRPEDVRALRGDASKAKELLGWTREFNINNLIKDMLAAEIIKEE